MVPGSPFPSPTPDLWFLPMQMYCSHQAWVPAGTAQVTGSRAMGGAHRHRDLRSVSGMELVMEELVEVIVLMDGLIPYAG